MIKFFIRYLSKRGFLILHKGDSKAKTVFFDQYGEKWTAFQR